MAARVVRRSGNRHFVHDLLVRARRYHCSVSGSFSFDVTDLLAAIEHARAEGRPASLVASLVRATSLVVERYPRLNHHLFHGLFRQYEVAFDEISCTLILMRRAGKDDEGDEDREALLFPLVLRGSNRMSIEEIQAEIDHHKRAPLESLPQVAALRRLERLPRLALRWFSYKARSDWKFFLRYFGTYGLSSLVTRGWGGTSATVPANNAAVFLPGTLSDQPVVRDGAVVVRKLLSLSFITDHYILDGRESVAAMKYLRKLLEQPARIGLTPAGDGS